MCSFNSLSHRLRGYTHANFSIFEYLKKIVKRLNTVCLAYGPVSYRLGYHMVTNMGVPKGGGPDFEFQYKWNPFEKLMIP